jgi:hypothetical protein
MSFNHNDFLSKQFLVKSMRFDGKSAEFVTRIETKGNINIDNMTNIVHNSRNTLYTDVCVCENNCNATFAEI